MTTSPPPGSEFGSVEEPVILPGAAVLHLLGLSGGAGSPEDEVPPYPLAVPTDVALADLPPPLASAVPAVLHSPPDLIVRAEVPAAAESLPTGVAFGAAVGNLAVAIGIAIAVIAVVLGTRDHLAGVLVRLPGSEPPTPATPGVNIDGDFLPTPPVAGPAADFQRSDPSLGKALPHIVGTDISGEALAIRQGTPMVIAVLAHWSPESQTDVVNLVTWSSEGLLANVVLIGVSTAVRAGAGNYPPSSWLLGQRFIVPTLEDDDLMSAARSLAVIEYPTYIAVDAAGVVVGRHQGSISRGQLSELVSAAHQGS